MTTPIVTLVETRSFNEQVVIIENEVITAEMRIKSAEHFIDKDEFLGKEFPGLIAEVGADAAGQIAALKSQLADEAKTQADSFSKIHDLEADLQKARADLLAAQNEVDQLKAQNVQLNTSPEPAPALANT